MSTTNQPKIAFSTLACPMWTLEQAAEAALRYGYQGLELRLLDGELLTPDLTEEQLSRIKNVVSDSGLEIAVLDTSVRLTSDGDQADRELVAWCEVASTLRVPFLRVFGGQLPDGLDLEAATARAADRLARIAPHAEDHSVRVVLETHDAFRSAASVAAIVHRAATETAGVVWDIANSWQTGDTPQAVWDLLDQQILHVHVKDIGPAGDNPRAHVMLGEGHVPNREAVHLLLDHKYDGWLSVEWEKKWHPEIAEPDVALPHHMSLLRSWLAEWGSE